MEEIISLQTDINNLRKELDESKSGGKQSSSVSDEVDKVKAELERSYKTLELEKVKNKTLSLQLDKQQEQIIALDSKFNKIQKESKKRAKQEKASLVENEIKDYGVKQDDSPTAKVGKLRKYRGYKDSEEKTETNKNLLELVKEYRDRMANGESKEEIALSIAKLNPEKLKGDDSEVNSGNKGKAYSPNRSFGELMEDSERRNVTLAADDVEKGWSEGSQPVSLEGFKPEDIEPMPEKANLKPLLITAVAACVVLGLAGAFFFMDKQGEVPQKLTESNEKQVIVEDEGPNDDESIQTISSETIERVPQPVIVDSLNIDLTSEEIKQQALGVLRAFHESKELDEKATYCRVPSRTLQSMKDYYSNEEDVIAVAGLRVSPELVVLGDLKLIKTDVIIKNGDVVGSKLAFFELNDEDELKLDWYNYVDNEAKTWDLYVGDKDASPTEWKVKIDFNGDEHPDFSAEKYAALRIRSFSTSAINQVNAYLSKEHPVFQDMLDAYQTGQQVYILKLRNLLDDTGSFMIDDVISLHSFYTSDLVATEDTEDTQ